MVDIVNSSQAIGQIISAGTNGIFGSLELAIITIVIFLLAMAFMFGIPLEYLAIIILPLSMATAIYLTSFWVAIFIIIIYVAMIIAKNWLFR